MAPSDPSRPTVVLVHGAFAESASWSGVVPALQAAGCTVVAAANPLRGVASDAASVRAQLDALEGPIVLVGHSYGGAVITNAANGNPNVKALVYIAAFAPESKETVLGLVAHRPGSLLPPALVPTPFLGPDGTIGIDTRINPLLFRTVFAQDVSREKAAAMAKGQHPAALPSGSQPSGPPAWKRIPSWFMVARNDRVIPPAVERFMAARAGSRTVEVSASHAAHVSQPGATTDLVLAAAAAV